MLSIIAILSGICAGSFVRLIPAAHLAHASRAIVGICRSARFEAIRKNRPMRLECSSTANSCTITDSGEGRVIGRIDLAECGPGIFLTRTFSTDFTGRGSATRAGTMTVANEAGRTCAITVRISGGVVAK